MPSFPLFDVKKTGLTGLVNLLAAYEDKTASALVGR